MATIQELEQKIQQLEKEILAKDLKDRELIAKSEKAIDVALHAYRVDHYAYIWVWDYEKKAYRKTNMRVGTPDVEDYSITERKMADDAISTRTIQNGSVTEPKLAGGAVSTRTIQNGGVTKGKIAKGAVEEIMKPITDDLQNQIDSFNEHGVSVSNEFGDDPHIGISQKTLTQAINRIWDKLSEITGEVTQGISMVVTPTYFMGDDGCTVHITANTVDTEGIFEKIFFYWNNSEIPFAGSNEPTDLFEADAELFETAIIKCRAKILGIWYEAQEIITHNDIIWIGAGTTYTNVFNDAHKKEINTCCWRANYDVPFSNGDNLIIIMGDAESRAFQRADMNGIEIAFTSSTFTDANGNVFRVYTSDDTYQAGTYNIDING